MGNGRVSAKTSGRVYYRAKKSLPKPGDENLIGASDAAAVAHISDIAYASGPTELAKWDEFKVLLTPTERKNLLDAVKTGDPDKIIRQLDNTSRFAYQKSLNTEGPRGRNFDALAGVLNKMKKIIERDKADDIQAARAIRDQIGRQALLMYGAKNIRIRPNELRFDIGRNAKAINSVIVKYDRGRDTYVLSLVRGKGPNAKVVKSHDDVYADQLTEIISNGTGLYSRLI